MMTAGQKLEVIEAFVNKGQGAIEVELSIGFGAVSGDWTLKCLLSRFSQGHVFRVKPVPHKWQNLIDFIKKGDFGGKKGIRFGKNTCDLRELQELLFNQGCVWIFTGNKLEYYKNEMAISLSLRQSGISLINSDLPLTKSDYLHYNPDTCQFVEPKMVPWTREDVPPVCWLREKLINANVIQNHALVLDIREFNILTYNFSWTFQELLDLKEYSIDLKIWKPCGKEAK